MVRLITNGVTKQRIMHIATVYHKSDEPNDAEPRAMLHVRCIDNELEFLHVCRHSRRYHHELWLPINYDMLGRMAAKGFLVQWTLPIEAKAG